MNSSQEDALKIVEACSNCLSAIKDTYVKDIEVKDEIINTSSELLRAALRKLR